MPGPDSKENSHVNEAAANKPESFASKIAALIAKPKEFLQRDKQAADIITTAVQEKTGEAKPKLVENQEYHDARAITVEALGKNTDPETIKKVLQEYIEKQGPGFAFKHVNTTPDIQDDPKVSLRHTMTNTSQQKNSPQI